MIPDAHDPNLYHVTVVGPATREQKKNLLRLKHWSGPEWRKLIVEIRVGSERWPDWDAVNIGLTAIKDLIKLSEGFITDDVVRALKTHADVVTYETFRGPPAGH